VPPPTHIAEGVTTQDSLTPNGISLNSLTPNGVSLNSLTPNGLSATGTPIGISLSGAPLAGADLVGSTWTGRVSDGTTLSLRLDAAMQGTGNNADVWSYKISALVQSAWQPLCLDSAGNPNFVDSVSGTWNYAQGVPGGGAYNPNNSDFTIACRGSAIAKCVELGYKPWLGHELQLAACVRALRADYCGDGTPFTVNGTIINIFDNVGIQADAADWIPEAAWTSDGATCVSKKKDTRFDQVVHRMPDCYPHAVKPQKSCGTEFDGDEVIITELAPH
jgi:hypothetical protein